MQLRFVAARRPTDFEQAFSAIKREGASSLSVWAPCPLWRGEAW